jgi:class 3 adenylate cyclase
MEAKYSPYRFAESRDRLDEILDASDANYEELDSVPSRDRLTFVNGFYVNCSALFVDIRDSASLPAKHKRPTLAKIYRAYISELIAVLKGDQDCREVTINGDAVWAVYDTPKKADIDGVFSDAARANSMVDVLNYKLKKKAISPVSVGLGMSYGRALMIKAGYKGSGIHDVVWMGDVVNDAAHLAAIGRKTASDRALMLSEVFRNNLNATNQAMLRWNTTRKCYDGNIVNTEMNDWLKAQR